MLPIRTVLLPLLALALAALALPAGAFETRARAAYVYDVTTDTVLLEKNADLALPPASMSKLMTLNMLFEALADGRVTLDTRFRVSTRARQMGGSTMFLNERDRPTVEELIKGIVVLSGNDACVVVAEGLAGTEEAFARLMNERARALGLTNSTFANASGWPHPNQRMSARDLGKLAVRLITQFPEYYGYFSITEWPYDGRAPQNRFNRNPLLKLGIGADGLKTGHTEEAGYGLVGSAVQGNRRIVFVIMGLESEAARAEEGERIINWAFRQFVIKKVAAKGQVVAEAPVWLGQRERVGLAVADDLELLVPALVRGDLTAEARFRSPLEAPVAAGQEVGRLTIRLEGLPEREVPLVAAEEVSRGGIWKRVKTALAVLMERYAGELAGSS
ncbi:D-alanyl-D-alanine carboxypeptidase (penicillin-binding protein 5/6) [Meinhardsimonia xiamenensis]|jgi:D-alanyl-D-alanine carboxypeptidase (penicillin-binding protein 5/6)|uniref:serine-type D-Ala-D-Ala carboxypeptidase n=1 Tax=Meinhardsimonia xiamenensis TaxID=990712 RepID=A0A1G9AE33_9RHOB|nr:D-alanyl-D-alanine carboxypeptidase family protein [Meinhardsimonia xiamenensis]PRX35425.1 D-alanyl-D-alanine carboxypeptidase (penicillin-binding protein 5/6) [Meinhardsimonia xiamenensis]SDK25513.1 D-alanyl-D-alanine carboxypeptidase (penicillin-binding protein 5/6) [Meinhardsimonia xiamenensis]